MNTIPLGILILAVAAIAAVLGDPKAQRHLAAWLRARADRQERMRDHRKAERALEIEQRAMYLRAMEGA